MEIMQLSPSTHTFTGKAGAHFGELADEEKKHRIAKVGIKTGTSMEVSIDRCLLALEVSKQLLSSAQFSTPLPKHSCLAAFATSMGIQDIPTGLPDT